ncbi:hypothetical protein ACFSOZ_11170 [Mesorhizobium newzealandense]|uniref:Uncharacterized protein n=1 Tax=Mesorhizobium newzealandense TaxID=1300302 RepID=A0ABW4U8R5_9HYPH
MYIFAAIRSGLQVFGSALEAVERPGLKTISRCEECRVSIPHTEAAVEAPPILLLGLLISEFCQLV